MKQYYNPAEAKKFFHQLQKDLIKDRQDETCTASPLYYGIMDNNPTVTAEGYEDFVSFYHPDTCESVDTLEDLFHLLRDEDNLDCLIENAANSQFYEPEELYDKENDTILKSDMDIWQEALEDMGWNIVYMQNAYHIKENVIALTRKAAQKHLTENQHHYTNKATTYAMSGWRSPQFEHLLALLHQIDWEHSTLQFRIPKCMFYTEAEMEAYMDAYLQFCSYPKGNQQAVRTEIWNNLLNMESLSDKEQKFYLIEDVKTLIWKTAGNLLKDSNEQYCYQNLPGATILPLFISKADKEAMFQHDSGQIVLNYYYEMPHYVLHYKTNKADKTITLQIFQNDRELTAAETLTSDQFNQSPFVTLTDTRFNHNNKYHVVFSHLQKEV